VRAVIGTISALVVIVLAWAATAQDYRPLFGPFDASRFSQGELRFLQLGLAEEGYYDGLLDGDWGRLSAQAMESYASDKFSEAPAQIHAAVLTAAAVGFLDKYEWD
jgi:serine protease Do